MANLVKHRFASAKANGPDATQVQPSHWNDGHLFTGGNADDILARDPTDATYGAKWVTPSAKLASIGIWQPFTPQWKALTTMPTLGNGTIVGRYMTIGKTCWFHIDWHAGTTTTFGTGTYTFTLPLPALTGAGGMNFAFSIWATLGNGWNYTLGAQLYTATEFYMPLTNGLQGVWTATAPIAMANNDQVSLSGCYELATAASLLGELLDAAGIVRPSSEL